MKPSVPGNLSCNFKRINPPLIISKIEICLTTIVQDEHLSVSRRII
jgi:hypothetical protein